VQISKSPVASEAAPTPMVTEVVQTVQ
jgi:hypothetical protein